MTKILITGGAGFIGSNIAKFYLERGNEVIILDNLSRKGVEYNLEWLRNIGNFDFIKADVRDKKFMEELLRDNNDIDIIFHEAAQVAVTTSVQDPVLDFETNVVGTFNILESMRKHLKKAILVYASTNKVYGDLSYLNIIEKEKRYEFEDNRYKYGLGEDINLDFHSPYGCSKGSADQYVRDYHRIYGLKTIVFRQSCIYGTRQIGLEDQGWVAWFIIRLILNKPVSIYGTGKQVRDILFIDDLLEAYDLAIKNINITQGKIYNIGGGYENSLSLLELIDLLKELSHKDLDYDFSDWRPGDQKIFISDNTLIKGDLKWEPKINYRSGIEKIYHWILENKDFISSIVENNV
ncbi:MAG: SDR family NAD(P)-dependent oxidoreductase [Patescibacteria group bacterium]|nr:SDR family NAD(P)-dependent oxidoreductase [Patescibacteria group bacterium]